MRDALLWTGKKESSVLIMVSIPWLRVCQGGRLLTLTEGNFLMGSAMLLMQLFLFLL